MMQLLKELKVRILFELSGNPLVIWIALLIGILLVTFALAYLFRQWPCITADNRALSSTLIPKKLMQKRLRERRRANGQCVSCDIRVVGYAHCTLHRRKYNNAHNRRTAERIENNQCTSCGAMLSRRQQYNRRKNCPNCRKIQKEYKQQVRRNLIS